MDFSSDKNSLAQILEFLFPTKDASSLIVVTPDLMML